MTKTNNKKAEKANKKDKKKTEEKSEEVVEKEVTPYASFTKPVKIVEQFEYGTVVLREYEGASALKNNVIILGFQTESLVSQLTAKYIVKELKLPLIGDIISEDFPAVGVVTQGISSSAFRIYGDERIVVFASDLEPEENPVVYNVVKAIYEFAKRHSNSMIIMPDSLTEDPTKEEAAPKLEIGQDGDESVLSMDDGEGDESDTGTEDSIGKQEILQLLEKAKKEEEEYKGKTWYATNSEELSKKMAEMEHKPVRNLVAEGLIGAFIASMSWTELPVVCIWAPQHKMVSIGTKAAVSIIQCVDNLLGQGHIISIDNLNKTTKEIEQTLINVVNKMVDVGAPSKEKHHSMYM